MVGTHEAPTKIARVLQRLTGGASLNRFEAERLGDHCLHSTISRLFNRHGLIFERQHESVPNNLGRPCQVIRYSLPASERKHARNVLAMLLNSAKRQKVAA